MSGADTGTPSLPPPDGARPTLRLSVGAMMAIGGLCLVIGAVLIVPLPFVAVGVAAWWLAGDLSRPRRRYPGGLGIGALVLLSLTGGAAAVFVIGFDTHFDCGGTLGGYGAGASAELDEACVDARGWRIPALMAVMVGATVLAALAIRRTTGVGAERRAGDPDRESPPRHRALAAAVVLTLTGLWTAGIAGFVVS